MRRLLSSLSFLSVFLPSSLTLLLASISKRNDEKRKGTKEPKVTETETERKSSHPLSQHSLLSLSLCLSVSDPLPAAGQRPEKQAQNKQRRQFISPAPPSGSRDSLRSGRVSPFWTAAVVRCCGPSWCLSVSFALVTFSTLLLLVVLVPGLLQLQLLPLLFLMKTTEKNRKFS